MSSGVICIDGPAEWQKHLCQLRPVTQLAPRQTWGQDATVYVFTSLLFPNLLLGAKLCCRGCGLSTWSLGARW